MIVQPLLIHQNPVIHLKELHSDWKTTFEKELKESYNVTIKKYQNLGNGLYCIYINTIDTGNMPYTTVDSQTGNFYG